MSLPQCSVLMKTEVKKGKKRNMFTKQEDWLLFKYAFNFKFNWKKVSRFIKGKSDKQCSCRWENHVSPFVNRQPFTPQESAMVIHFYQYYGSKWEMIASKIPGRNGTQVRNHFNSLMKKEKRNNDYISSVFSPFNGITQTSVIESSQQSPLPPPQPQTSQTSQIAQIEQNTSFYDYSIEEFYWELDE